MGIAKTFSPKRQSIEKARTTVVFAVIAGSVVVSFSLVGAKFLWDLQAYNNRILGEKKTVRKELEANLDAAGKLVQSFELFEQSGDVNSQTVLDALPSKYDFPALVTSLDSLAKRSGVVLDGVQGDDIGKLAVQSQSQPAVVEMEVQLTVKGGYGGVKKFMDTLDRSIRPINVSSIEVSGSDSELKADIKLVSYYQPAFDLSVQSKEVK